VVVVVPAAVIEEHGPHLPLGVDIYKPISTLISIWSRSRGCSGTRAGASSSPRRPTRRSRNGARARTTLAKTPHGYFGDPASADRRRGEQIFFEPAAQAADAILTHMDASPWMKP